MSPRSSLGRGRESVAGRILIAASALGAALRLLRSLPVRVRYARLRRL
jgi:hypothetical protein